MNEHDMNYELLAEILDPGLVKHSKNIHENQFIFRRATRGVLKDKEGNIAILNVKKFGFYKLPGGGVEYGEKLESALKREMVEETGTKCKIINKLGITIEGRKSPGEEPGLLQVSYGYSAEVIGNKGQTTIDNSRTRTWL